MQPYFLPYIGYFQLLKKCDEFVIYDDIEYTKRGWINRNYFLQNKDSSLFSIPIKKDRDTCSISQRVLADKYDPHALLRRFKNAYRNSPQFDHVYPLLEKIFLCEEKNLFRFIYFSLEQIMSYLDIDTPIYLSSEIHIDSDLRSEMRVLAICQKMKALTYVNPIGGVDLYHSENFKEYGINLNFLKPKQSSYRQFDGPFVANLSILDVLMFNSKEKIEIMLTEDFDILETF